MSIRTAPVLASAAFLGLILQATPNSQAAPNSHTGPNSASPRVPFTFVENRGQASPAVRYIGSGPELKAWFEDAGVVLQHGPSSIRIEFGHSSPVAIRPDHPLGATANFLYGNDSRQWQTGVPLYGGIRYTGLWSGVDLTYAIADGGLKAEYTVAPGAGTERITLRFGADPRIQPDGTLRVHGVSGDFIESRPLLYQSIAGERKEIAGGFRKLPDGAIGFWAAAYDHAEPLVIDPLILFSGYFGGVSEDTITAVGIDGMNNVVTAGWTNSNGLPASGGAQKKYAGNVDAFVAAFLPNGGGLIYCTYLGGSGGDQALGLSIDSTRNVYVTGWTSSRNFPVVGAFQTHLSGTRDAFVTKLNPSGNALIYSTYLGGSGVDAGYAITVNSNNQAIVVGDTASSNLPVTGNVFQPQLGGSQDAFAAMLSPAGNTLSFLTYLGGNGVDHASSVSVSSTGSIYIGGYTWSSNFPVLKAFQPVSGGGQDGFLTRLYLDGSKLVFSTYLGGSGGSSGAPEAVTAVALNSQRTDVYVAGTTSSANFPVTSGAFQTALKGQSNGFVANFTVNGAFLQSTYLGGSLSDGISAMTLDFHGNPYVTGSTDSPDFPVQYPIQALRGGGMDAFAAKLNPTLSALAFSTYLGGMGSDGGNAIAVDFETSIIVAGQTSSGNFPTAGNLPSYNTEMLSSFLTKIAPSFTIGVGYGSLGSQTIATDVWHTAAGPQISTYGLSTDLPITGDWNATGKKLIGVFRNGTWYLDTNGNGILDAPDKTVVFGQAGDIPVVGDWLGTGHIALGIFRHGTFILDLSGHLTGVPTGIADATFVFGQGGDVPVAADWNQSGATKVGIFRNGLWLVDYTGSRIYNNATAWNYGQSGDLPVAGDWDSSGHPNKIGVYRAGLWILDYDGDHALTTPYLNELVIGFGQPGYAPLVF